jgi:AcrR family transcriptional regulator
VFVTESTAEHRSRDVRPGTVEGSMSDPRIVRTRASVLDHAIELVVEGGPAALTVDAVVARSGVAKSTIYRHWPTRDALLIDVFDHCAPVVDAIDPDADFETALRALVRDMAAKISEPRWARVLPALLMLKSFEAGIAGLNSRLHRRQSEITNALFDLGDRDGQLPHGMDRDRAVAQLLGPLIFAQLSGMCPCDDVLADVAVEGFLAWLRSGASDVASAP